MDDVKIFTDEKNNVRSAVGIIGDQHLNAYLKNETMVLISSEPDKGPLKVSKVDGSDETEMEEEIRKLKNVDDKLVFDEPEMDSVQKGVSGLYIAKWKDDKERNTNFEKELIKSIEEFEEIKEGSTRRSLNEQLKVLSTFVFGAFYSSSRLNPVTNRQSCLKGFRSQPVKDDLYVCITEEIDVSIDQQILPNYGGLFKL
ncbi:unnamed protein product [Didymodactylos carnosus]|uniref:Uncharacterized protein n=1 Tax=Didymodactylos carnosus TaxID=1234261 RepID=A0A8S2E6F5_9BILA|nr:unnamed protein product [Didymodactylos carnosus]CAF3945175.1 unnamed protein product [Didymodactylos carnosus]